MCKQKCCIKYFSGFNNGTVLSHSLCARTLRPSHAICLFMFLLSELCAICTSQNILTRRALELWLSSLRSRSFHINRYAASSFPLLLVHFYSHYPGHTNRVQILAIYVKDAAPWRSMWISGGALYVAVCLLFGWIKRKTTSLTRYLSMAQIKWVDRMAPFSPFVARFTCSGILCAFCAYA